MAAVEYKKACDLCGQFVEIEGFSLMTEDDERFFCCAGCQHIYQLLYLSNPACSADQIKINNNEDN